MAKPLGVVAAVSFALHLVWENVQAPLFTCFWLDFRGCLAACLRATVGDTVITLAVWGAVAAATRNANWAAGLRWPGAIGLALLGAGVAVGIERHALAFGRWAYTAQMPLLPGVAVGLTPVLQMAALLPLTCYLAGKLIRRII